MNEEGKHFLNHLRKLYLIKSSVIKGCNLVLNLIYLLLVQLVMSYI